MSEHACSNNLCNLDLHFLIHQCLKASKIQPSFSGICQGK